MVVAVLTVFGLTHDLSRPGAIPTFLGWVSLYINIGSDVDKIDISRSSIGCGYRKYFTISAMKVSHWQSTIADQ